MKVMLEIQRRLEGGVELEPLWLAKTGPSLRSVYKVEESERVSGWRDEARYKNLKLSRGES